MSGPRASAVAATMLGRAAALEPRHATLVRADFRDGHREVADEVIATFFPAPHSYTGDDVVEISAHGSPVVLEAIVATAVCNGARIARPGEFTLRAFLHGRLDLVQAEAVADLIEAATPLQARAAFDQLEGTLTDRIAAIDAPLFDLVARLEASLDFPDEGYHFVAPGEIVEQVDAALAAIGTLLDDSRRGRAIREGATVVIAGRPNVGKSSLFNRLAGFERAIVTAVPGTTRDLVTERIDVHGLSVTLVDTAGARATDDLVEREGVSRAERARDVADLVVVVLDGSEQATAEDDRLLADTAGRDRIVVANKADRDRALRCDDAMDVSAMTGAGLDALRRRIASTLTGSDRLRDTPLLTNARHAALLDRARTHLDAARASAAQATPEEFVITDLTAARSCFDEIVGVRTTDDLLRHIFDRFCIGK